MISIVKKRLRRVRDWSLRKMGLVRISALPMRSVSISHHHPRTWAFIDCLKTEHGAYTADDLFQMKEKMKDVQCGRITIDGVLRNGRRVTGELKEVVGPYGYPDVFQKTG